MKDPASVLNDLPSGNESEPGIWPARKGAEYGRTDLVVALHAGEVEGWLGLAREDEVDEALLVVGCSDRGVESPFIADGAHGDGAERFAAGAARAVGGPDLDEVGDAAQLFDCGEKASGGRFHVARVAHGGLEQIGATEIAHEHEVARGHPDGGGRVDAAVGDEQGEVLGRVPGRVDRAELDVADREGVAVFEQVVVV